MRKGNVKPVTVDWDEAYSACNSSGDYSVYYDVEKRKDGWWLGVSVDGGDFTHDPVTADGPYPTEDDAVMGGENAVYDIMAHQFKRIYWNDRAKKAQRDRKKLWRKKLGI